MILTFYRLFTPYLSKIKIINSKFNVLSCFFSSKALNSLFNTNFFFFPSNGILLFSNKFSLGFYQELINTLPAASFSVTAFVFNKSFLNFFSFSFEELFTMLSISSIDLFSFLQIYGFFFSNLFFLLAQSLYIDLKDAKDIILYKSIFK